MTGLNLAFLHPYILAGFLALPVLWLILKFLPPQPKQTFLPTARFLLGLTSNRTVPAKAPWWLILLRLSILALLILACAGPILNPQKPMTGNGPFILVFDNGWGSAQTWSLQMNKAEEILHSAKLAGRPVQLQFTAIKNDFKFIRADQAIERLRSAEPQSWPNDFKNLRGEDRQVFWISAGLNESGFTETAINFARNGLILYMPDMRSRPGILRGGDPENPEVLLRAEIPSGGGERRISLQALDIKVGLLGRLDKTIQGQSGGDDILEEALQDKKISQWKSPSLPGVGGVYLNDIRSGAGLMGLVSAKSADASDFTDPGFYLSKAVEPSGKVERGNIEALIKKNCAILVLPDIAAFSPGQLSALEDFLNRGGIVLRFGGTSMAEVEDTLLPVPLKTGMRSLSGDMSWTQALKLASFTKNSPFAGQSIPDVTVERQLLALPSAELEDHVWAKLSDGTPFITARPQGRGLLVLVHTTATPEWSDFVLSGFYISFLKEIQELASLPDKSVVAENKLYPLTVLNGWGQMVKPDSEMRPLSKSQLQTFLPDSFHPPGYYGDAGRKYSFNLGDRLPPLEPIRRLPSGAQAESLTSDSSERNLASLLFGLAALLFLLDWTLLIASARFLFFSGLTVWLLILPLSAHAATDIEKAGLIHLACLKTSQDMACLKAMGNISEVLKIRTSVEIGEALIVDPARDDLSFYPLIYWPVDDAESLSAKAKSAIAAYLSKGGMILIDTRDGAYETGQVLPSPAVMNLRVNLQGMDIPPLKPAPTDHVLFKSFYLLNLRPEYDLTGKIWVEEDSLAPDDDLSAVMITGEDWLNRWAYPSDARDEEMASRFGVNLVMYALTGNYKTDQVHMKAILERMGR